MARPETVATAAALDTWTSLVKSAGGALGFCLLAIAPLVARPEGFPFLPDYVYVVGGILTLQAATMRLRSMLIVLGCLGLTAALAFTVVATGQPHANQAALALYCGSAVILGAAGRHTWMFVPFLLVPVLIVAPNGTGWAESREAFSSAWTSAMGCADCFWGGLPAGLAIAGAAIGVLRVKRPPPVRPSALPMLIMTLGLLMGGLIVASLLPDGYASVRSAALYAALLAAVLGWVALAYQIGRVAFVWEAAGACAVVLAGALFLDPNTQFPGSVGPTMAVTIATSMVPAVLAGVGLLVRKWIGTERPVAAAGRPPVKPSSQPPTHDFFVASSGPPEVPRQAAAPKGSAGSAQPPRPPAQRPRG